VLFSHGDDSSWGRGRTEAERRLEEDEQELCTRICKNIRHNLAAIKSYQKVLMQLRFSKLILDTVQIFFTIKI
jgi:hypothetical protein